MDGSHWCLDECPTCSNLVPSGSVYCSAQCQPDVELESQAFFDARISWSQRNDARICAWALDCHKARPHPNPRTTTTPAVVPSHRKLHLRSQRPTALVTTTTNQHSQSPSSSSPISTSGRNTAVESLELVSACSAPQAPSPSSLARYLNLGRRGSCPPVGAKKSSQSLIYTRPTTPSTTVAEEPFLDKWGHAPPTAWREVKA
ncbi:hypothetical protein C8F01DRAFT_1129228 [Mycena amicta]|nr:hypothetical protein C8F01DRAFT_1129228 [Mycena amicta]